jgi:hypothetical protein
MPKVSVKAVPANGFYRAGMKFTREPRVVDVDAKILAVLKAEPMLVVEDAGKDDVDKKKK